MTSDEARVLLEKEAKNGNKLASTYLAMLKDATPTMKEKWFSYIAELMKLQPAFEQVLKHHVENSKRKM